MKNKEIKILLEKYFDGESTVHEEKILRHYFLYEEVADDLQEYKIIFSAFESESKIITEQISDELFIEESVKTISLKRNTAWAVAATVLILITSWFTLNQKSPEQKIPTQEELQIAQKFLKQGLQSFQKAYHQSNDLIKITVVLQTRSKQALEVGRVYQKNTKEINNLKYINQSLEKLHNISSIQKSRIKLIM
jgi:hypothetical protein